VRRTAAEALGKIGDASAVEALQRALADTESMGAAGRSRGARKDRRCVGGGGAAKGIGRYRSMGAAGRSGGARKDWRCVGSGGAAKGIGRYRSMGAAGRSRGVGEDRRCKSGSITDTVTE
jgi:hypothetical protein